MWNFLFLFRVNWRVGGCLCSVHLMGYLKLLGFFAFRESSSVVLFIVSQEFVCFFLFPFIFLLMAMTMLKPWTSQTGWTAASWNMDNFGESAKWVSLTSACLGERGRMLCIGSCAWWKLRPFLQCWFCQSLLNFNLFLMECCFFLFLFYHWLRWRN